MRSFGVEHNPPGGKDVFDGLTANDIVCVTVSATCAVSATDIIAEVVVSSVVVSTSGDFIADTISATGNITADTISALTGLETDGYVHADGDVVANNLSANTALYVHEQVFYADETGAVHAGGSLTANNISATGNLTADNISALGSLVGATTRVSGDLFVVGDTTLGHDGTGNLTVWGTISGDDTLNVANMTAGTISSQGGITVDGTISGSGDVTGASGVFTNGLDVGTGRVMMPGGTNDTGIVFGSLGTATKAIDVENSGLVGATDYWIYGGAANYWAADGTLTPGGFNLGGGTYITVAGVSWVRVDTDANKGFKWQDDQGLSFGNGADATFLWETAEATHAFHLMLDSVGRNFVIGDRANIGKAFDHGANANPTLFIHDATNPDTTNNLWGSFAHDGDSFILSTGANTGTGTSPSTVDNAFIVAPQGTEQVRVGSAGTQVTGAISGSGNISTAGATIAGDLQAHRFLTSASNDGGTLETTQFGTTVTVNSAQSVGVVLPSVATGDIGGWFRFMKLGAGTLAVCAADSDVIASATAGSAIYNAASAETYATLTLQLADATHWVITGAHGTWTTL